MTQISLRMSFTRIPRTIDSRRQLPEQVTLGVHAHDDRVGIKRRTCGPAHRTHHCFNRRGTMNGQERRRRAIAAQGFAAIALFVFAHGARAATLPAHQASTPAAAIHCVAS
jgi:hypothetical protein